MEDGNSAYGPAQQIPGFQIHKKLAQGTTTTVFVAKQLSMDRMVALKVLPVCLSKSRECVDRFYRTARTIGRLDHRNIVRGFDAGEANGYHYLVMEFVDGTTADESIAKGKPLPQQEAVRIALETAHALAHAHDCGFVHRDIKPASIMLTRTSDVKLLNWSTARDVCDLQTAEIEAGRAFGTPDYSSPEQMRGELNIDFRTDVYALGATLVQMLTGRVPFDGPAPSAVMGKPFKEPLTPPDHVHTAVSGEIGTIVQLMMAKRREDRPSSMKEVIGRLSSGQHRLES